MAHTISHFSAKTKFPIHTKSNAVICSSTRSGPNVLSMAQNQSYWTSIESEIETYLKQAIPIRPPESVFEPMHHLTFAAPRTTAPALCLAACELVGGDRSQAMAAAAAVHLIHAAAYTHENLPLTDRAIPKPEIPHQFNPNIELLTGDGIIPFGFELLARSMDLTKSDPDKILRVIIEMTRASGSEGIIDGQYHELGIEINDLGIIEYVSKKKEGELHACGAACGAILGGGAEEEIEKLRNFGLYLGMIKGMLGKDKQGIFKGEIEKLKGLALKELGSFGNKKIELVAGLLDLQPSLSRII